MPKKLERALTPRGVVTAKAGMHADGGGLYLQVTSAKDGLSLNRSWIFRYRLPDGRLRDMGLGPLSTIGLSEAREKAREHRAKRLDNIDPIEERRAARAVPAVKSMSFDEASRTYIAANEKNWKNEKHRSQWWQTIKAYASPVIGNVPVRDIDTNHLTKVLEPIWAEKPETASRLRGRIEVILSWAKVLGLREGENPARWRGHLDQVFAKLSVARKAKRARTGRGEHQPALPYGELPGFLEALLAREGIAARALEFTILTAARTSETIGAGWDEIDTAGKLWTVPAERMKADREHRIPLCDRALEILEEMREHGAAHLFHGDELDGPLSDMAMAQVVRRMNREAALAGAPRWIDPRQNGREVVPHGFRSTFRDWAAERTNFPSEMVEMALAHAVDDKVEAAYRRGDLFLKRRKLMDAWAAYCGKPALRDVTEKVVAMRAAHRS